MPDDKIPPAADNYGYRVVGFVKEAIEEGDAFLRAQPRYNKIEETINAIMGEGDGSLRSSKLSSTSVNQIGKTFLDMTAGLTDVKPFWEYRTFNKRFEQQTAIYGKLSTHVWLQRQMDSAFMYAVQYALAGATSYFETKWDAQIGDFTSEAWDPRDVLPIRPVKDSPSIQDAYGVVTRRATTVNHARYLARHVYHRPDLVDKIHPDRDGSLRGMSLRNTRVGQLLQTIGGMTPFQQRLFGDKATKEIPRIPTVDLNTAYVADDRRNEGSAPIHMGEWHHKPTEGCRACALPSTRFPHPVNNWAYIVEKGDLLYPRKRMVVTLSNMTEPLYDGPSPWWHGKFPLPKLTLDPVGWSYLGRAPLWDLLPLNQSLNKLMRVYDDWTEQLARRGVVADKNSVSEHMLSRLDTRKAGWKIRHNPAAGKGIQIVDPPALPPDFWRGIEFYITQMHELSGQADISSLMRLNQVPSGDTIEKIMESMSLSWRGRSRAIEVFMREHGMIMAYNFAQFYTLPKRLALLGPDGAVDEDFDFDPQSLVPDFVESDDYDPKTGFVRAEALDRGPRPRIERAASFLRQFSYHIAPGSLLAASEIQRKLLYLQLSRAGLIDIWSLLEVLGIPNVGTPPAGSIPERLAMQQEMGIGMQANPAGRKASGQSMPRMQTKEGGSRTTISESG